MHGSVANRSFRHQTSFKESMKYTRMTIVTKIERTILRVGTVSRTPVTSGKEGEPQPEEAPEVRESKTRDREVSRPDKE
jgi:hypothetical protein